MTNNVLTHRIGICIVTTLLLAGCQTVKMPKIDIMKSPEFSEDAENIATDYPRVKDAPLAPTDIRSDEQWDQDARTLQKLRATSIRDKVELGLTEAEAEAEFEALKAKAQAYKKDDPQTGPVEGFPDYKPRR